MPKYRILSLDGGGIRGIATAVWLNKLEEELGSALRNHFDLIAGTSTGSILATAIGLGIPASEIIDLYREKGQLIFPSASTRLWSRITRTFAEGLSAPKYPADGLESALKDVFGKKTMGMLKVPTLVFTYNVFSREPLVFKSYKADHATLPVWQVTRASCSAPTYFPAMVMKVGQAEQPLVDGGVAANNPSACVVAEGIKLNAAAAAKQRVALEDFVLASFGTGSTTRSISAKEAMEWGALEWAIPIIDVLFDGSTDTSDYVAQQIISDGKYFRFQMPLEKAYDDMDKADPVNLNALVAAAENYLTSAGNTQIKALKKLL